MASAAARIDQLEQQLAAALLEHIKHGRPVGEIEMALAVGADANGHHRVDYRPLMVAAYSGNINVVHLLLSKGADVDARALRDSIDDDGVLTLFKGTRALHCAIYYGELGTFRVLIRAGADVNARDSRGRTPLMATCMGTGVPQKVTVQMARELLEAGASASLASSVEGVALHFAVAEGYMDLVDVLLQKAPQTLNIVCERRGTPLFTAANIGLENVVSQLLAAGARQPTPFSLGICEERLLGSTHLAKTCPLRAAIVGNHVDVVRVLLDEGVAAIGGWDIVRIALIAVMGLRRNMRFLRMLLSVEGVERRAYWANITPAASPLLNLAASFGNPAAMSILLTAGADPTVPGYGGKLPGEMIGSHQHTLRFLFGGPVPDVDSGTTAAIHRVLERAPAFRALSWLYPIATVGSGTKDRGVAEGASLRTRTASLFLVRIYRPQRETVFVRGVGRYVRKSQ